MNHTSSSNKYLNKTGSMVTSFSEATVWEVVSYNGGYALKNIEGNYMKEAVRPVTFTSNLSEALLFTPTDCEANVSNMASGYNSSQAVRWKLKGKTDTQMNTNGTANDQTTTVQFNTGTGNWTCLFTYEVTVMDEKSTLGAAIASANTFVQTATEVVVGYPNSTALGTLQTAIDAAQNVYDNGGDYAQANQDLADALAAAKTVANAVYTPRTDVYYTITSARGSMIYHPDYVVTGKENISFLFHTGSTKQSGALNVALDKDNANHQWGFIEKDGKYYMYNVGKKQFANVTQNGSYQQSNGDKHTWMFSDAPSAVTLDAGEGNWVATPNVRVRATSEVTGKQYAMSISQSYDGPVIAYDDVNDGGIPMAFAIATTTQDATVTAAIEALLENLQPYRDALQEAITAAEAVNFGTKLGQYVTSEAYTTALNNAIAEKAKPDAQTSKEALVAARKALENAIANLQLNLPKANTFLRIKGQTSGKYLAAGLAENNRFAMTDAVDATTIFCFDGTKLINYSDGMVNGMSASAWAWVYGDGAASEVTFQDGLTNGGYGIKSSTANFYDDGDKSASANRGAFAEDAMANQNVRYRNWYLEEVTTLSVKMNVVGDKSYATFYSPVAISQVEGAEVYVVNETKDNSVVIEKATAQAIPAGKGVMLVSDAKNTSATLTIGGDADFPTGLNGVTASQQITKDTDPNANTPYNSNLFLSKKDGKIGFYKIKTTDNVGVTGGFKAYLENVTVMNGAKDGFEIEFGGVTGIENMEHGTLNMENGAVYNLQGQRVNKAQKGVFIQNGKKVVLK